MTRIVPAEWEPHEAIWVGFPSHENLWQDDLIPAQAEVAALVRVLVEAGGERIRLLVMGAKALTSARALLGDLQSVEIVEGSFGDIWLRDTGPVYIAADRESEKGPKTQAQGFRNNGWGGKYHLKYDDQVAEQISAHDGYPLEMSDFIIEGGALEHDGFGTVITTRQCLLNPNRNPEWTQSVAEKALMNALGARKIIWLNGGLLNDHTDGHIDNLVRFVAPGVVICPLAYGLDDPNAALYDETARTLAAQTDARGRSLQVVRVPSPGKVVDADGEIVPASHMNFLIANDAVVVPVYSDGVGEMAVEAIASLFPERTVLGLSSKAILTGGGAFHCISQQVPEIKAR